ncbi:MAG: hypothetical protein ABI664_08070, partial [bacterium]
MDVSAVRRILLVTVIAVIKVPSRAAAQDPVSQVKKAGQALERAAVKRQTDRATERFDPIFKKYTKRYFGIGTDWRWFKA